MINATTLDELAQRLAAIVPPGMKDASEDLGRNFRAILQSGLGKLDLVTREEFDVQRLVLLRTREKIELLERQLAKEFMALQQGARNAVVGSQDAQRNRQVETTTILGQVSRSEPDRHLALRILKLAIEYGGAYPVACFANGGFRQADNRGARQAAGQMHFADHQWRIHAFLGTTVDDGKTHGTQVLGGSIDSSAPLPA